MTISDSQKAPKGKPALKASFSVKTIFILLFKVSIIKDTMVMQSQIDFRDKTHKKFILLAIFDFEMYEKPLLKPILS